MNGSGVVWFIACFDADFYRAAPCPAGALSFENVPLADTCTTTTSLFGSVACRALRRLLVVTTASFTTAYNNAANKMPRPDVDQLDSQIARLRSGGTLTENEVKVLCDKVSI